MIISVDTGNKQIKTVRKTFTAGLVGISLIAILLIVLYRFSGLIASVSIIAYTFLTLLIFNLVGGRLSLQGIAALVIGIGMAVDSAVISYARIREELKRKVSLKTAYEKGSKESFISILDANVTTLIAAIILFIFGESSVKGFATMLIISIIVTFVVMVYLNRHLISKFVQSEKFEKHTKAFIGYKESKKENKFDFVKPKNIVFIIVLAILASFSGSYFNICIVSSPNVSIIFVAVAGPTPLMFPFAKYVSSAAKVCGINFSNVSILNCSP